MAVKRRESQRRATVKRQAIQEQAARTAQEGMSPRRLWVPRVGDQIAGRVVQQRTLVTREGGRRLLADPVIEALRDLGPLEHEVVDIERLPDVDGRPSYQVKIRRVSRFSR